MTSSWVDDNFDTLYLIGVMSIVLTIIIGVPTYFMATTPVNQTSTVTTIYGDGSFSLENGFVNGCPNIGLHVGELVHIHKDNGFAPCIVMEVSP